MNRSRLLIAGILVLAVVVTGCSVLFPEEEALTRGTPSSGTADFSVYVALGNSLTAGYQSGALYESAQQFSYPALLADVMTTTCEQPLIADPGLYDVGQGHLQITFNDEGEVVMEPIPWPGGMPPAALNGALATHYNNLGIPGALTADLLATTLATNCVAALGGGAPNPHFDMVLRNGQGLWGDIGSPEDELTAMQQAIALSPTFLSLWIGNNEILGSATNGTDVLNFDLATFTDYYTTLLNGLQTGLSTTGMIVANIPPVTATPFFTTVPFCMLDSDSNPIDNPLTDGSELNMFGWLAEEGVDEIDFTIAGASGPTMHLVPGDLVLLPAKNYIAQGMGIPDFILIGAIIAATGMDPVDAAAALPGLYPLHGTPLPANLVLTLAERTNIATATGEFNAAIDDLATARGIPVVDINGFLAAAAIDGVEWNGTVYTSAFGTGGIFSLDGIHPTNIGQAMIAGEFIKVINEFYGAELGQPNMPETRGEQMSGRVDRLPAGFPNLP
ncbi:MAG: hypothetical protein GY835_21985 [bacterium]|nr:hypothetical protein [bacterium]